MFKEYDMTSERDSRLHSSRSNEMGHCHCRSVGRWAAVILLGSTLAFSIGCQRFQNLAVREAMMVSYRDMVWSKRAYNLRYGSCARPYGDHFQCGFEAGYTDVCNGGDGYVPAMPPQEYRAFEYQSGEGVECVNAWFEGYPAGVAAAKKEEVGDYNNVLISKMINSAINQEKAQHVLPGDVPIVSSSGDAQSASANSKRKTNSPQSSGDSSL